jgi:hypothetical protein
MHFVPEKDLGKAELESAIGASRGHEAPLALSMSEEPFDPKVEAEQRSASPGDRRNFHDSTWTVAPVCSGYFDRHSNDGEGRNINLGICNEVGRRSLRGGVEDDHLASGFDRSLFGKFNFEVRTPTADDRVVAELGDLP